MSRKLHRFNWFVLLGCMMMYAVGGTLSLIAAFVLAGNPMVSPLPVAVGFVLGIGLYAAAFCALHQMESVQS